MVRSPGPPSHARLIVPALILCARALAAQQPQPSASLPRADASSLGATVRALAAWSRVAGTAGSDSAHRWVGSRFAALGLDTASHAVRVYLPLQDSAVVERHAAGVVERLAIDEPPLPGEAPGSAWMAMNGSSGPGDVRGPLVYANYGLEADYRVLDSLGVDVRGKVVLARYGRGFRGIKARDAERRGAAALLIYSDPADDGYVLGDVYPRGPMRPPAGVQRGSIKNAPGDPSTPLWPATPDARRLPEDEMEQARIPVLPIGYGNAARLLELLTLGAIPQSWQGGLPFRYHTHGDGIEVRVGVWVERGERAYKTVVNTVATLRGSEFPDEVIVVGAHRDSWGPGAADNASGTASVLEAARLLAEEARQGRPPRRTIVFAAWDAEERGLIGSTEWVESREEQLTRQAVAYVNQDMIATGRAFSAGASGSLAPLVREVARLVPQPGDTGTVLAHWSARTKGRTPVGALGGGSDFSGFYNHLGIPSISFGFGGPQGIYHSNHDTPAYVERFGDPGYLSHAAAASITALLAQRLADADVVPYDYAAWGRQVLELVAEARKRGGALADSVDFAALDREARRIVSAGEAFNRERDRAAERGRMPAAQAARVNAALRRVERGPVRAEGVPGRPWMRNVLLATDRDDGYGNTPLPGVVEALQDRDLPRARAQAQVVRDGLAASLGALEEARRALR